MTDAFRHLRTAIVAVVNGDATLQTLMGRASKLITTWKGMKADAPFPVIAYQLSVFSQNGKDNDTRDGDVQFSIFAEGNTALQKAEDIAERLETILTHSALLAANASLDATPLDVTRLYVNDVEDEDDGSVNAAPTRNLERVDVRMRIEFSQSGNP